VSPMLKQPLAMEHALLGFLHAEPMHAYQLHQQLTAARDLGLVWRIKEPQLYRLVGRLEEAGYVRAVAAPQETRPTRKMLYLTPAGEAAFQDWLRAPVRHGRDLRLEFMAKLYFARQAGPDATRALVNAQRRELQAEHDRLTAQAARISDAAAFDRLVLEFRLGQLRAMLEWLDLCEGEGIGD